MREFCCNVLISFTSPVASIHPLFSVRGTLVECKGRPAVQIFTLSFVSASFCSEVDVWFPPLKQ